MAFQYGDKSTWSDQQLKEYNDYMTGDGPLPEFIKVKPTEPEPKNEEAPKKEKTYYQRYMEWRSSPEGQKELRLTSERQAEAAKPVSSVEQAAIPRKWDSYSDYLYWSRFTIEGIESMKLHHNDPVIAARLKQLKMEKQKNEQQNSASANNN